MHVFYQFKERNTQKRNEDVSFPKNKNEEEKISQKTDVEEFIRTMKVL